MLDILLAAVRNNAKWCDSVTPGIFTESTWYSPRRTPDYYPDAITLRPTAIPDDFLPHIDASPGCSVKDSFAALDLTWYGFVELFRAQWIHRPAGSPGPIEVDADLTHAAGVVGVTNAVGTVWSAVIGSAAARFPGVPLVGYERGADLTRALASGFTTVGPLVVWQRPAN
ncbi:MAG TPA: hypothetical protein VGN81_17790 [Pseudonocardiaceae bacterium]